MVVQSDLGFLGSPIRRTFTSNDKTKTETKNWTHNRTEHQHSTEKYYKENKVKATSAYNHSITPSIAFITVIALPI